MTVSNLFIFNHLQGYNPFVFRRVEKNAQAHLDQEFTVSTVFSTEGGAADSEKKAALKPPQVTKNKGFPRSYSRVSTQGTESDGSNHSRASKEADREHKHRAEQSENTVNSDSHDAERQRQQPNEGIKHQNQQGNRPAQKKQDNPQEESSHGNLVGGGNKIVTANAESGSASHYSNLRK